MSCCIEILVIHLSLAHYEQLITLKAPEPRLTQVMLNVPTVTLHKGDRDVDERRGREEGAEVEIVRMREI